MAQGDAQPPLHSAIVAMVSLAAGIAAKHPAMGLCQLDRLRALRVPEHQIETVVEIARHLRDEAAQQLDAAFDAKAGPASTLSVSKPLPTTVADAKGSCCSTAPTGKSCC